MGQMTDAIMVAILAVIALAILSALVGGEGNWLKSIGPRPLMTAHELSFFSLLRSVSSMHVCPQVSMGAILQVARGGEQKRRRAIRNRFAQKVVDFILIDDEGRVRLIVELDDRTHNAARDGKRDAMTAAAGYRTVRVRGAAVRNREALRELIEEGLAPIIQRPVPNGNVARFRRD